jgi:hypothetical protein
MALGRNAFQPVHDQVVSSKKKSQIKEDEQASTANAAETSNEA